MVQASFQSPCFLLSRMLGRFRCRPLEAIHKRLPCLGIVMPMIWMRRKKSWPHLSPWVIWITRIAGRRFSRIRSKISTISQGSGPLPIPCFGILCTRLLGSQAVPASCRANHKNRPILSQQKTAGALACHPGTATAAAIRVWMTTHLHPEISSIPTRKTSSRKTFRSSGSTLFLI